MTPRRERGTTLLELMIFLSLAGTGLSAAMSLYHADRLAGRRHAAAFEATKAVSAALCRFADDAREAVLVVPRASGPGALAFLPDGTAAVWYDRPGSGGELHRKLLGPDGATLAHDVVARGVGVFDVRADGPLVVLRAAAGSEDREMTVRCRHAE